MATPSEQPSQSNLDAIEPETNAEQVCNPEEMAQGEFAKEQEAYRQAYLLQLRRMSCPGCGDDGIVPG
jgi:hypothetical protein